MIFINMSRDKKSLLVFTVIYLKSEKIGRTNQNKNISLSHREGPMHSLVRRNLYLYVYLYQLCIGFNIYLWQYPVKGSIFDLIFLEIVVNNMALPFCFFGLSSKIQSRCFLHVKGSPKIPRLFQYLYFLRSMPNASKWCKF